MNSPSKRPVHRGSVTRRIAAVAILMIGVALAVAAVAERQRANHLEERVQGSITAQRSLERQVQERDSAIADKIALFDAVTGPGVEVIQAGAPSAEQPNARMFWNRPVDQWTLIAHNLPRLAPDRTYQVWLTTRTKRTISLGVLSTDASGDAQLIAHYAMQNDELAAIAVTAEPARGSPRPTTPPILTGRPP